MAGGYYIYALADPSSGLVRYVGATTNLQRRYNEHLTGVRQGTKLKRWVGQLRRARKEPALKILEKVSVAEWEGAERKWIRHYRDEVGPLLLNRHYGGVRKELRKGQAIDL